MKTLRKFGFPGVLLVVVVSLGVFIGQSVFIGQKAQELWQKALVPVPDAQVTIDLRLPYATIPPSAFGMNTAVWDNNLLDARVPGLLRQAGITMLRFPGGSTADGYHWQNNSITLGRGYINPHNTFDAFMGVVHQIDARAFITVNYGSNIIGTDGGDPTEAAAWVQYANIIKRFQSMGSGSTCHQKSGDLCQQRTTVCAFYEGS
ncbi:MAG: hypothetical protein AUG51_02290 [Acidobacteria bacterium 13_1_20CM_3_53_8]|nr:MAG: hypothetical protein AUG51_02290 [Acidobacteria bacterium 13_1_20CM_3_53_8]